MKKKIVTIQDIITDFNSSIFVIAEIGINHEGSLERCISLIDDAVEAGADAVKLQTINPDLNYCKGSESYKIFKSAELSKKNTIRIFKYCKKKKIKIFSTIGDLETLEWIKIQEPFAYKISSGLLNNIPFIEEVFKLNKPVFLSTGLANRNDLNSLDFLIKKYKKTNISILHCVSIYPTPTKYLDLNSISLLKKKFSCPIGYSDHSIDKNIPIFAVMAGAKVIEKHFTFDNQRVGFDHKLSFNKYQFKSMVKKIRKYEKSLSSNDLIKLKERQRLIFSRCIVAKKKIKKNEILTDQNIIIKRPNNFQDRGAEPFQFNSFIGKKINKDICKDDPIRERDIYEKKN